MLNKYTVLLASVLALALPMQASAKVNASEASGLSALSSAYIIVVVPLALSIQLSDIKISKHSKSKDKVTVTGVDKQGKTQDVELPKEVYEKADFQEGDSLSIEPDKTGAMISRNGKPTLYAVNPEYAELSSDKTLTK